MQRATLVASLALPLPSFGSSVYLFLRHNYWCIAGYWPLSPLQPVQNRHCQSAAPSGFHHRHNIPTAAAAALLLLALPVLAMALLTHWVYATSLPHPPVLTRYYDAITDPGLNLHVVLAFLWIFASTHQMLRIAGSEPVRRFAKRWHKSVGYAALVLATVMWSPWFLPPSKQLSSCWPLHLWGYVFSYDFLV